MQTRTTRKKDHPFVIEFVVKMEDLKSVAKFHALLTEKAVSKFLFGQEDIGAQIAESFNIPEAHQEEFNKEQRQRAVELESGLVESCLVNARAELELAAHKLEELELAAHKLEEVKALLTELGVHDVQTLKLFALSVNNMDRAARNFYKCGKKLRDCKPGDEAAWKKACAAWDKMPPPPKIQNHSQSHHE